MEEFYILDKAHLVVKQPLKTNNANKVLPIFNRFKPNQFETIKYSNT